MADSEMNEIAPQLAECQLEDKTPISREKEESIQRCIHSLAHACTCRNSSCGRISCHRMKRVVVHAKRCKNNRGPSGNCPVCFQLIALCCYHGKHCKAEACKMPFCMYIRKKLAAEKAAAAAVADG